MARLRRSPPGAPRSRVPRSQQPLPQTGQAAVTVALLQAADAGNLESYYAGVVDALNKRGRLAFGPTADGAWLEGSKAWMKEVATAARVPTAAHAAFVEKLGEASVWKKRL